MEQKDVFIKPEYRYIITHINGDAEVNVNNMIVRRTWMKESVSPRSEEGIGIERDTSTLKELENEKNPKASFNYGLSLLRVLFCFEVILLHCWDGQMNNIVQKGFYYLEGIAVPVFMTLSFFLCRKSIESRNVLIIKNRIKRLVWPHIGWSFLYYFGCLLVNALFNKNAPPSIFDLGWQLLLGHSKNLNPPMWYLVDLIILSIVCFFVYYYSRNENIYICILSFLFLFSLFLQYSGINYMLNDNLRYEMKYPIGRITEMIPYMVMGLIISRFRIFELFKTRKTYAVIIMTILLIVSLLLVGKEKTNGYGYKGLAKIIVTFIILNFAYNTPFYKLPLWVKRIIRFLSKYTLGVYCLHRLMSIVLFNIFSINSEKTSFIMCVMIYICCYFVSWLVSLIPMKKAKLLVD